jgi:hypothetical protein
LDTLGQPVPSGTYFYELRVEGKKLDSGKALYLR